MTQALREFALPLVTLPAVVWIAYWGLLHGQPVSDDILGIAVYDGKLQRPLSWHNCFKKLRYHFAIQPNPNKRWKEEKQPAWIPNLMAHHRLNLWVFSGVSVLLYLFLSQLLAPELAFLAALLWVVHPLGVQTVGWISGIGYVLGAFFMLIGLNVVLIAGQLGWVSTPLGVLGSLLLFGFCHWMAVEAMFQTAGATLILILLGQWPFAIVSGLISLYGCLNTLREAVELRKQVFHEQQMGQSTTFYPRKLIVVLKTLYYDFRLALFPKRLGLYHLWGYHYELPYIEQEDRYWVAGVLVAILLGAGIGLAPLSVQLGSLWFLAFIILFLNWITANQFVVDRYTWLSSFGVCLLAAACVPSWMYWSLFGIALMRTWTHLPTYDNEEKFYQSNLWNFEQSEVAYGNLGVTLLSQGWIGMALEMWWRGIQLNPNYDVCWYNLYSLFRVRGPFNPNYAPRFFQALPKEVLDMALQRDPMRGHLHIGRYCLQKAVAAKTCHFPQNWQKELEQLNQELSRPLGASVPMAVLVQPLLTAVLT